MILFFAGAYPLNTYNLFLLELTQKDTLFTE